MRERLQFDDPSGLETPLKTPASAVAPLFVGQLTPGVGARLLMQLFSEGANGRLIIEAIAGDPRSRVALTFVRGEPAHAEPVEGASALWRQLGEVGLAQARRTVAEGVASLARAGVPPVPVLEALRELVRQSARAAVECTDGGFSYFEDPASGDHVPLVAVNPFGLLLAAKRASLAPDALLRSGERIASAYVAPGANLAAVTARISAFTGHLDVAPLIDGTRRGADLFEAMRLDSLTGGLVLAVLADCGLLTLSPVPRASPRPSPASERARVAAITLPAADEPLSLAHLSALGRAESEILSLYLELKPERDHTALLGVDIDCKRAALDRAYEARLAQLDPRLIPAGPVRPYLLARIEELRFKLDRAYKAHAARTPRETSGAYLLLDRLGAGGMAEVFRGRSMEDNRIVAIKRIRPENKDDTEFVRKLLDEARLARRVRHPNVVRVHTAGRSGEDLYLAMDYVEGADLHALLAEGRKRAQLTPIDVMCRIVADASGGLHAAHSTRDGRGNTAPILHCDVSTSNILVGLQGEVKLTDFGIARALGQPSAEGEGKGLVRGKLPYLAPEMFQGGEPSIRTDTYAMGMTLYAALIRLPFLRASAFDTMRAALQEPLPLASSLRADVPPAIDAILARVCARDPAARYSSAQELQLELEAWLSLRPPVDVGAWARSLAVRVAAPALAGGERERTVSVIAADPSVETPQQPIFARKGV